MGRRKEELSRGWTDHAG